MKAEGLCFNTFLCINMSFYNGNNKNYSWPNSSRFAQCSETSDNLFVCASRIIHLHRALYFMLCLQSTFTSELAQASKFGLCSISRLAPFIVVKKLRPPAMMWPEASS